MNRLLCLILVVVAAAVLTACGDSDDTTERASVGGASAEQGTFPVTIEHLYGSTEIAKQPTRVVTIGLMEQDALLALGITPVGTTEWFGEQPGAIFPWAKDEQGDAPNPTVFKSPTGAVQFEKVARLKPDLILALYADLKKADYDKLSELAPVVVRPKQFDAYGIPWQEITRIAGRAVGRPEKADDLIAGVEGEIDEAKRAHPEFAANVGLMATYYEGTPFVYGPKDPRGRLLSALGFTLPEDLQAYVGKEFGKDLSEERSDLLDVETIVWLIAGEKDKQIIRDRPLYKRLDVRNEEKEVFLDETTTLGQAASFISVLSLPYLLDELVPQLSEAAKKE